MQTTIKGYNFTVNDTFSYFWPYFKRTNWEKFTFDCIEKNKGGKVFWDMGAWIGPISLYASKIFDKVAAWEPDNVAHHELMINLRLNSISNVFVNKKGIYSEETTVRFGKGETGWGDSTSSINSGDDDSYIIETMTINQALDLYGQPSFVKIDIEGGEEYILDDLINHRFNKIHLSVHNAFIKNLDAFLIKLNILMCYYDCWDWHSKKISNFDMHMDAHNMDLYLELKK